MAAYTVNETIRLLWQCSTNQLDNAMKLFVNEDNPNPSSDLGRSTDEWHMHLVIDCMPNQMQHL